MSYSGAVCTRQRAAPLAREHDEHDTVAVSEMQLPEERQLGKPFPFFWQACAAEKKVTSLLLLYYNKLSYC